MAASNADAQAPADITKGEQAALTFHGRDGTECEDFINNVRCKAFEQGKLRDNEWLVTFAKSACRDGALQFLDSLDDSVKGDWKQLRKALLKRYPAPLWRGYSADAPNSASRISTRSVLDAAPAAPPPTLSSPPPAPLGPLPTPVNGAALSSIRGQAQDPLVKGYIKVTVTSDKPYTRPTFEAYIAKPDPKAAVLALEQLKLTSDLASAQLFGYSPSQVPYAVMNVLKCWCTKDCLSKVGPPVMCNATNKGWHFLEARWSAALPGMKEKSATLFVAPSGDVNVVECLPMWQVGPNRELTPVKIVSSSTHIFSSSISSTAYHAEVVVKPSDMSIRIDAKVFDNVAPKLGGWKHATVRFQPL